MKRSLRVALVTGMVLLSSSCQDAAAAPRTPRRPRSPRVASTAHRSPSERPRQTAVPTPRPTPKPAAKVPSGSVESRIRATWPGNDDEIVSLVKCESGMNPTAHSSSGRYHGLVQADSSFSRSYAGVSDAHTLSVEGQIKMAWRAYSSGRGYGPWPNCGRRRFGSR